MAVMQLENDQRHLLQDILDQGVKLSPETIRMVRIHQSLFEGLSPAEVIRSEIKRRKWSFVDLANAMGVAIESVTAVTLLEARVEQDMAERLSKALNLPPDYFLMLQAARDNPGLVGFYWGKWEQPFSQSDK